MTKLRFYAILSLHFLLIECALWMDEEYNIYDGYRSHNWMSGLLWKIAFLSLPPACLLSLSLIFRSFVWLSLERAHEWNQFRFVLNFHTKKNLFFRSGGGTKSILENNFSSHIIISPFKVSRMPSAVSWGSEEKLTSGNRENKKSWSKKIYKISVLPFVSA